jgi:hypothetical protein
MARSCECECERDPRWPEGRSDRRATASAHLAFVSHTHDRGIAPIAYTPVTQRSVVLLGLRH